jgi:hypothetical protein
VADSRTHTNERLSYRTGWCNGDICVREVLSSNLGWDTGYLDLIFRDFAQQFRQVPGQYLDKRYLLNNPLGLGVMCSLHVMIQIPYVKLGICQLS